MSSILGWSRTKVGRINDDFMPSCTRLLIDIDCTSQITILHRISMNIQAFEDMPIRHRIKSKSNISILSHVNRMSFALNNYCISLWMVNFINSIDHHAKRDHFSHEYRMRTKISHKTSFPKLIFRAIDPNDCILKC